MGMIATKGRPTRLCVKTDGWAFLRVGGEAGRGQRILSAGIAKGCKTIKSEEGGVGAARKGRCWAERSICPSVECWEA